MEKIFITGVSGYLGQKVLTKLGQTPGVRKIVGIDVKEPTITPDNFVFYKRDVREPLAEILKQHEIDCMLHMAYVITPLHEKGLAEDINIGGTNNVLDACLQANVKQIVYTSSATAYGFHPDNDVPLTEESPLRGNDDYVYTKTKKELEATFNRFIKDHPDYEVAILRLCYVAGPHFDNLMARHLQSKFVLLPSRTEPGQYVHEDDLVDIVVLAIQKHSRGVYNVGADGTITFPEMVKILGNHVIKIPFGLMYTVNNIAWNFSLSKFCSPAMNTFIYPWVVSSEKLKKELGYRYKYTSREAFIDFVQSCKKKKLKH